MVAPIILTGSGSSQLELTFNEETLPPIVLARSFSAPAESGGGGPGLSWPLIAEDEYNKLELSVAGLKYTQKSYNFIAEVKNGGFFFSANGKQFQMSAGGMSVYDGSDPAAPVAYGVNDQGLFFNQYYEGGKNYLTPFVTKPTGWREESEFVVGGVYYNPMLSDATLFVTVRSTNVVGKFSFDIVIDDVHYPQSGYNAVADEYTSISLSVPIALGMQYHVLTTADATITALKTYGTMPDVD